MAATLTQQRVSGPGWVFERKFDGIRLLAFKDVRGVRLYSRTRRPVDYAYPAIVAAVASLPATDLVLDGEATGGHGDFGGARFDIFDAPWFEGRDLTAQPLSVRRQVLETLPFDAPLRLVERLAGDAPWEACAEGWEGVIAKREESLYEQRRSRNWLKLKCELMRTLVVGGFTEPRGSRAGLGALLAGYFERGELRYAGRVGTGFTTALLMESRARLDVIEQMAPPFADREGLPPGARWVRPEVCVDVAFLEWTRHGKMRHPRLLHVHPPGSVVEIGPGPG
jgi:ATP-dependent DNA ligase